MLANTMVSIPRIIWKEFWIKAFVDSHFSFDLPIDGC